MTAVDTLEPRASAAVGAVARPCTEFDYGDAEDSGILISLAGCVRSLRGKGTGHERDAASCPTPGPP